MRLANRCPLEQRAAKNMTSAATTGARVNRGRRLALVCYQLHSALALSSTRWMASHNHAHAFYLNLSLKLMA